MCPLGEWFLRWNSCGVGLVPTRGCRVSVGPRSTGHTPERPGADGDGGRTGEERGTETEREYRNVRKEGTPAPGPGIRSLLWSAVRRSVCYTGRVVVPTVGTSGPVLGIKSFRVVGIKTSK